MVVGEIMEFAVLTVQPDMSVSELEDLLGRHRISGLPVVDDTGKVIGMVSKSDVVSALREVGGELYNTLTVKTVMSPEVVSCEVSDDVASVARTMREKRIHRVVVCEAGRVAGIVTTFDMLTALIQLS